MSSTVLSFSRTLAFHLIQPEAGGGHAEDAGRIDVTGNFEGVLGAIGQLVHVDEQRVHLARGARIAPADRRLPPAAALQAGVDSRQFGIEQLIVGT